jgi:hypothetical protein
MVPQLHYGKPEGVSSDAMEVMAFVDDCAADSFLRATQVVHRRCVLTKRSGGWKTEREGESAGEGGGDRE